SPSRSRNAPAISPCSVFTSPAPVRAKRRIPSIQPRLANASRTPPAASEEPESDQLQRVLLDNLGQFLNLARRSSQRFVELRIHQQLSDGALSGVDLIHHAVDPDGQLVETRLQLAEPGEGTLAGTDLGLERVEFAGGALQAVVKFLQPGGG